jgi:hypothetical protein
MKTNTDNARMAEFGKLEVGNKFYLSNPIGMNENAAYTKILSQKDSDGKWSNANNVFGLRTFVQYDKRIWVK